MVDSSNGDTGDDSPSPSEAIIDKLAEETETFPTDLPPLYDTIDPDALDQLFLGRDDGSVTFTYCGYEITITSTGDITVCEE